MKTSEIIGMLNYPDAAIVKHAVERANLTAKEWEAISLRVYEQETIESAAERLLLSDSTIKRRYAAGMRKLNACWSAIPWIRKLIRK